MGWLEKGLLPRRGSQLGLNKYQEIEIESEKSEGQKITTVSTAGIPAPKSASWAKIISILCLPPPNWAGSSFLFVYFLPMFQFETLFARCAAGVFYQKNWYWIDVWSIQWHAQRQPMEEIYPHYGNKIQFNPPPKIRQGSTAFFRSVAVVGGLQRVQRICPRVLWYISPGCQYFLESEYSSIHKKA